MGSQEEAVGPRGGEVQVGEERQREELMCELGAAVERALQGGGDRALGRAITASERILCHGSSQVDLRGRAQCRTFVLGESSPDLASLTGSASIAGWLQLHLANQSLVGRLRELYSERGRLGRHYRQGAISLDPVSRQTFLQLLESLQCGDRDRLAALQLPRPQVKVGRLKGRRGRGADRPTSSDPPLPASPVLVRPPHPEQLSVCRACSLPDLTGPASLPGPARRGSLAQHPGLTQEAEQQQKFRRSHQRARSDTTATSVQVAGGEGGQEVPDSGWVEGSWAATLPASTGWTVPRPRHNQSLVQFISETGAGRGRGRRAQLDRENAHFILSEAMISTFEQMNFEQSLECTEEEEEGEEEDGSDEEIRQLKAKLARAEGKRRSQLAARKRLPAFVSSLHSDGMTDGTTDQSASPGYSDCETPGPTSEPELDSEDSEFAGAERGGEARPEDCSAESIALCLLSRVGGARLPPADKLTWLVSREDSGDQGLLPLPDSTPVDPDSELAGCTSELRGTLTWAPPRPQIILTVQQQPGRRTVGLSAQRWHCSGCGMKVEQRYSKSYRWCNYLGKYFCSGCHTNQTALIPARIIHHWDFKNFPQRYPVSQFSLEILQSLQQEPLFNIHHLNPALLKKVEKLRKVAAARAQLSSLARYVSACRLAGELPQELGVVLVADTEMYSLAELCETKAGRLAPRLRQAVQAGLEHVRECELCQARGHICQGCTAGHPTQVIFPFQAGVVECEACWACHHRACYSAAQGCVRCRRKQLREQQQPSVC